MERPRPRPLQSPQKSDLCSSISRDPQVFVTILTEALFRYLSIGVYSVLCSGSLRHFPARILSGVGGPIDVAEAVSHQAADS